MKKNLRLRPFIPFLFILLAMIGAYAFAYFHPQTLGSIREIHLTLKEFNAHHPIATPLLFMSLYILYAVLMLPGIFILSLVSGFLFPQPFSTLYVIISATIGSSLLFLAARTAFREILARQSNSLIGRLESGFRKNSANYMLFLRLIPLFPFKIVNLAGAFFGVPFSVFVWTTFWGMIPSVFIYTQAGQSLSHYFDDLNPFDPWSLFDPTLIAILSALALLSLIPIFIKNRRERNRDI